MNSSKNLPWQLSVLDISLSKLPERFVHHPRAIHHGAYLRTRVFIHSYFDHQGTCLLYSEAYPEDCHTSKIGRFVKIVNDSKPVTIFAKRSILYVDRLLNKSLVFVGPYSRNRGYKVAFNGRKLTYSQRICLIPGIHYCSGANDITRRFMITLMERYKFYFLLICCLFFIDLN